MFVGIGLQGSSLSKQRSIAFLSRSDSMTGDSPLSFHQLGIRYAIARYSSIDARVRGADELANQSRMKSNHIDIIYSKYIPIVGSCPLGSARWGGTS